MLCHKTGLTLFCDYYSAPVSVDCRMFLQIGHAVSVIILMRWFVFFSSILFTCLKKTVSILVFS